MKMLAMLCLVVSLFQWNLKGEGVNENYVVAAPTKEASMNRAVELFKEQHPSFKGELKAYSV